MAVVVIVVTWSITRKRQTPNAPQGALKVVLGSIALGVVGAVMITLVGVGIGALIRTTGRAITQTSGLGHGTASPQVFQQVTSVPASVFDQVDTGGLRNPLTALPTGPVLKQHDKPEILSIGAEYCPFCAAERWSLVVALSRFGTWQSLNTTTSSDTDVYPDTYTFTFVGSDYTSDYITFVSKELQDRNMQPLQSLMPEEQAVFNTYDAPPYVSQNSAGGIPFTSFGNQYMTLSSGYSPQLLQGLSWVQIAGKLSDPNDPVTQGIVGNANYLTAAICKLTGNIPGNVCGSQTIQHIAAQLPKGD